MYSKRAYCDDEPRAHITNTVVVRRIHTGFQNAANFPKIPRFSRNPIWKFLELGGNKQDIQESSYWDFWKTREFGES